MQTPFGSEGLDMPGLSYVCAAADLSLRMLVNSSATSEEGTGVAASHRYRLFSVLNAPLDKAALMARSSTAARWSRPESAAGPQEEEDDEEDDHGGED